ncbi:MAG: hypothetical protein FJ290_32805, partial [Planctomycetes bacterium]|nr:hypothetical protein [Planctomycetota bacterium]
MNGCRLLAWGLLCVALALPAWADEVAIASVDVRNLSGQALENVPVTFGLLLRKGEVPKNHALHCSAAGRRASAEVKRVYDDGSPRFAIVSAIITSLPANGSALLTLTSGPEPAEAAQPGVGLGDLLKTDFDAVVTFTFPDGAVRSASARAMLTKPRGGGRIWWRQWLGSPVASEWLVSAPPWDKDGEPDEDLDVQFHVRAYAGLRRVRVSVVVENCWDTWAGNIRYDAAVTVGGKQVFTAKAVDHRRLARWRKVFWWGGEEPPTHV